MSEVQVRSSGRIESLDQRRSGGTPNDVVDHEESVDTQFSLHGNISWNPDILDAPSEEPDSGDPHLVFSKKRNEDERGGNNGERSKGKSRRLIERREEEKLLAEELAEVFFEYSARKQRNRRSQLNR